MSDKVIELRGMLSPDNMAQWISTIWSTWNNQRAGKVADWVETQKYIFATDTTTTENKSLPWKNSTTLPKLCQLRDNLHSNYLSALFPNDKWLQWKGYTKEDSKRKKAKTITAYMENKTRESGYRQVVSRLIYDYIDYGNSFVTVAFEERYKTLTDGTKTPGFIGPKAVRISPYDIVFNPLAASFEESPKIIRSLKTLGELKKLAIVEKDQGFWTDVIERREEIRRNLGGYSKDDFEKASLMSVDGFGNLYEYYLSEYVEILEFYGDYHDDDGLKQNRMITVADRSFIARDVPIPTFDGTAPIRHVGWRLRPDNLWAMGPLDNLIGIQYRIDHLENLKADAMDLIVHPPLKIIGEVEEFVWGPGVEIHLDENGDVSEVSKNLNAIIVAENHIQELESKMELYAGAPREAMGIRSPGEKTAFEVQTLDNASGRIFQEKVTSFEINLVEKNLNDQLEISIRNFKERDIVRSLDNDIGVAEFIDITVDDITASGILRPIGARHFAQSATELQNIIGIANSPIWELIRPHTSGKALTKFVEDITALSGYDLFRPNVAVQESKETQALMNQAGEDLQVEAGAPVTPGTIPEEPIPPGLPQ